MSALPDWFIVYQIGILVVTVLGIIGYLYWTRIRLIHKVRFYKEGANGEYIYVGQSEFNPQKDESVSYGKGLSRRRYDVELSKIGEKDSNKTILFYDLTNEKTLQFVKGVDLGNGLVKELNEGVKVAKQYATNSLSLNGYVIAIIVILACFAVALFFVGNLLPPLFPNGVPVVPSANSTVVPSV